MKVDTKEMIYVTGVTVEIIPSAHAEPLDMPLDMFMKTHADPSVLSSHLLL